MDTKKLHGTQYIDELTTAERSIENSKRLDGIDEVIDFVGSIVTPENLTFGDETLVSTQATRAEDIVSVEDIRLQGEIDLKVDTITFEESQAEQDAIIDTKANQTDLDNLSNVVDGKVEQTDFDTLASQVDSIGEQTDINTSNITSLNSRLTDNEAIDVQQNGRLDILEDSIASAQRDYSTMTDSGLVNTTVKVVTPTIVKDFVDDYGLATHSIDGTTLELTTTIHYASTITADFYFNATQGTGSLVDLTVEMYNLTKGVVIDKAVSTMDFSGNINFESGTRTNLGDVEAGDQIQIRVYTDVGDVTINKSGLNMKVETIQGVSTTTYDYDITSTSVWGTETTQTDLNAVYDRILVNETSIASKMNKIVDVNTNPDYMQMKGTYYTTSYGGETYGRVYEYGSRMNFPDGKYMALGLHYQEPFNANAERHSIRVSGKTSAGVDLVYDAYDDKDIITRYAGDKRYVQNTKMLELKETLKAELKAELLAELKNEQM